MKFIKFHIRMIAFPLGATIITTLIFTKDFNLSIKLSFSLIIVNAVALYIALKW